MLGPPINQGTQPSGRTSCGHELMEAGSIETFIPTVLLLLLTPVSSPCPLSCSCYWPPLTVSCQSLGLTLAPTPLPPGTSRLLLQSNLIAVVGPWPLPASLRALQLHSNNLTRLHPSALAPLSLLEELDLGANPGLVSLRPNTFQGLSSLRALNLAGCGLSTLPAGLFRGLSGLLVLHLEHNALVSLEVGTFWGLGNLSDLFLHGNRLWALGPEAFQGLESLRRLLLHGNQLGRVDGEAFSGLRSLQTLFLFGNRLRGLPDGCFAPLSSLRYLRLGENPWDCGCQAWGLREWLGAYAWACGPVSCFSPLPLRGRDLRKVAGSELGVCGELGDQLLDRAGGRGVAWGPFLMLGVCICGLTGGRN